MWRCEGVLFLTEPCSSISVHLSSFLKEEMLKNSNNNIGGLIFILYHQQ